MQRVRACRRDPLDAPVVSYGKVSKHCYCPKKQRFVPISQDVIGDFGFSLAKRNSAADAIPRLPVQLLVTVMLVLVLYLPCPGISGQCSED
jgi:hypothetical protein